MHQQKILLLRELTKNGGNIQKACRDLDIPRSNHYWWDLTDPDYSEQAKKAIKEAQGK